MYEGCGPSKVVVVPDDAQDSLLPNVNGLNRLVIYIIVDERIKLVLKILYMQHKYEKMDSLSL